MTRRTNQSSARTALLALGARDVGRVLDAMAAPEKRQMFAAAGLRRDPSRLPRREAPELLRERLRTMPAAAARDVAFAIAGLIGSALVQELDGESSCADEADLIDLIAPALPMLVTAWSPALVEVLLAVLLDGGVLSVDDFSLLSDGLHASSGELKPPYDSDAAAEVGAAVVPVLPRDREAIGGVPTRQALDCVNGGILPALVLEELRAAAQGLDAHSAAAADDLLRLAPTDPSAWFLRGVALGFELPVDDADALPQAQELADLLAAGRITALIERGDGGCVAELAASEADSLARIVGTPLGRALGAAVVENLLDVDDRLAVSLLGRLAEPCAGWPRMVNCIRARSDRLMAEPDPVGAEALLRSADETLTLWTAAPDLDGASVVALQRTAAALGLARGQCRRARCDFVGAHRLLDHVPEDLLDKAGRAAIACERAYIAAGLAGLRSLGLPRSPGDRARLADRLERSRRHLAACLAEDPDHGAALVLSGLLAGWRGDTEDAHRFLSLAEARLGELELPAELVAAVRFERAVADLERLEPGTDEQAAELIREVLTSGYQPDTSRLVTAAAALDAFSSPHAGNLAATCARRAPRNSDAIDLVTAFARQGEPDALCAAQDIARDRSLPLATRHKLLAAALEGVALVGDDPAVEWIVDELEDVLARAGDPTFDVGWAAALATNQHLRELLGPAHADALRIQVLRRVGRIDEARQLARSLFYRSAAGAVAGLEPLEVLEAFAEMGGAEAEVDELAGQIRQPTSTVDAEPRAPVIVLVVGGDEGHARQAPAVTEALLARHGASVSVEWFPTGWRSGWAPDAARVESRYADADAVVLLTLIRTMLGRRLRRTAGESGLPWVACTGSGRNSIERAIERAANVAWQLGQRSPRERTRPAS